MTEEENIERNKKFIDIFNNSLKQQGLSNKTIKIHMSNIELYLNDYLNHGNIIKMEDGYNQIVSFIGIWAIREGIITYKYYLNDYCSTFKNFYKCMLDNNFIKKEDYKEVVESIKNNKEDWINIL